MGTLVSLDGTTLEGGGQLLRMATGLAALTTRPICVTDIRGKRSGGGGLKAQHLAAVNWLKDASHACTLGAEKGSRNLNFVPDIDHRIRGSSVMAEEIDIGSPGSIGLVFQAILPFIVFSGQASSREPFRVCIKGGTNVSLSPAFEYIDQVLLPTLSRIGLPPITAWMENRGWASRKQEMGRVIFEITPLTPGKKLPAFTFKDRGDITSIKATVVVPSNCRLQAERETAQAIQNKFPALDKESFSVDFHDSGHAGRLFLLLVATSNNGYKIARDWLYDKKIVSLTDAVSRLVRQVSSELAVEIKHGGCVDEYMRDQLVIFQALSDGYSFVDGGKNDAGRNVAPSLHVKTANWVVEQLLGASFDENWGCRGVGFVAGECYSKREDTGTEVEATVDKLEELQL